MKIRQLVLEIRLLTDNQPSNQPTNQATKQTNKQTNKQTEMVTAQHNISLSVWGQNSEKIDVQKHK